MHINENMDKLKNPFCLETGRIFCIQEVFLDFALKHYRKTANDSPFVYYYYHSIFDKHTTAVRFLPARRLFLVSVALHIG